MKLSPLSTRMNVLVILVAICPPYNFIQSPMDLGSLHILHNTSKASADFGRMVSNPPSAVLRPQAPEDISLLLTFLSASSFSHLTVAARGAGHSLYGQAQALDGIVIEMDSLPSRIEIYKGGGGEISYADVSAGVLWVELLEEGLKSGLTPRSWTDYLYLSIGGTLSNAGISGQTFKFGPQISNVLQLDVVTGRGELVTCSPTRSPELFHAVLGGLGQFGIITSARILLQQAPEKVKWFRAFYDDFDTFTKDQELLISSPEMVDYVEGFIVLNEMSLLSTSIAFPSHLEFIPHLRNHSSRVFYCIEFAVYCSSSQGKGSNAQERVEEITRRLSYMHPFMYNVEVSYFDFLNRVRMEELSLSERGLWDVPHPWLNIFIPKSGVKDFRDLLLESIPADDYMGLILIYPLLRYKWDTNMSAVLPEKGAGEEEVVYVVGMLQSAVPGSCSVQCLRNLIRRNDRLANDACGRRIGAKQYLARHDSPEQWRQHFGGRWERFAARKSVFDPLNFLSPGQGIFPRTHNSAAAAGVFSGPVHRLSQ